MQDKFWVLINPSSSQQEASVLQTNELFKNYFQVLIFVNSSFFVPLNIFLCLYPSFVPLNTFL